MFAFNNSVVQHSPPSSPAPTCGNKWVRKVLFHLVLMQLISDRGTPEFEFTPILLFTSQWLCLFCEREFGAIEEAAAASECNSSFSAQRSQTDFIEKNVAVSLFRAALTLCLFISSTTLSTTADVFPESGSSVTNDDPGGILVLCRSSCALFFPYWFLLLVLLLKTIVICSSVRYPDLHLDVHIQHMCICSDSLSYFAYLTGVG